ncbi:MAG: DUF2505 domain-containing protein [Nocardioides sp.]
MSKRLRHELTYDAPMTEVAEMLADTSFREDVCEFQGVKRAMVSIDSDDNGMEVTIDQVQAAQGIPSFARKFVGDEINIVQQESWRSPTEGDITVTIPGKPGEMKGTARLVESDGVTTETVDLTVKVNIPLVGSKIEGLIADLLLKALKAENKVGRDYLSR